MKKISWSVIAMMLLCSMFSCIDSKYHWDNLNKEGVLEVPPVPLGGFKALVLDDLFEESLEIKDLPTGTYYADYTFENLFGDKSIKRFFHDYVERDIILAGKIEMYMLGWNSELAMEVDFFALDSEKKILEDIKIKGNTKVVYGVQDIDIIIPQEDVPLMRQSEHLLMRVKLDTPKNITLTDGDSLKLSNMIIKTAGYLVDL